MRKPVCQIFQCTLTYLLRADAQIEVKEGTRRRVTRLVKPLLERPRRRMPEVEAQRFSEAAAASRRHARIFRK